MSNDDTRRNSLLDMLRFVSCLFVVLIHCPLPGLIGAVIITFGRYAVPFFLMISGWYLFSDERNIILKKARKQLYSTVTLIGVFFAVYLIMNSLCGIIAHGAPFEWVKNYSNFSTALYFLLFNRAIFFGSSAYYIFMMLYIYIIFIVWTKYDLPKYMIYLAPGLLVINIICGEYTDFPWFTYGNFAFMGIPCFSIGYLLHKYKNILFRFSASIWICLFVLGILSAFFEAYATKNAYCHFGSILMAISLLMISVHSTINCPAIITQTLHRYSTIIFIIHCGIRDIVRASFLCLDLSCPEYLFPFIVIFICVFICIVYDKVKKRIDQ